MKNYINDRDPETHKGHYGHALLIAGSRGKMGAAVLASKACLRAGAGLLTTHIPQCGLDILQTAVPEAMADIDINPHHFTQLPQHLERFNAIAIGPGLGTDPSSADALKTLFSTIQTQNLTPKLILDADALNIISLHPELQPLLPLESIITPHAGEYKRLFGDSDPAEMSARWGIIIVKKSHRTQIFHPDGRTYTNNTGNPGMATAGSGDVLTGILLGLAAQPYTPIETAVQGVYMHGRAGDLASLEQTQSSLIASDIIEHLKTVK